MRCEFWDSLGGTADQSVLPGHDDVPKNNQIPKFWDNLLFTFSTLLMSKINYIGYLNPWRCAREVASKHRDTVTHWHRIVFQKNGIFEITDMLWNQNSRSQWPWRLRCRPVAARVPELRVRIPPGAWIFVSCECCTLLQASTMGRSLVHGCPTECECVTLRDHMLPCPLHQQRLGRKMLN